MIQSEKVNQIAYIATREPSYSRVSIMRQALRDRFSVKEYLSEHKKYPIRLLHIIWQLVFAWAKGELRQQDLVVIGFFAQPIYPLVRFLYRGPIVADAYFSIYNTMVEDKGKAKPGSLLAKLCYWLDQHMLRTAECCLTDTKTHAQYFREAFNVPDARVERLWISAENEPLGQEYVPSPSETEFNIFFWGGFIPLQGVETIVAAADLLKSDPKYKFTIFGQGQTLAKCEQFVAENDTSNVEFCGWKSQSDIRVEATRSHLALGIFGSTEKALRVIPNKVFEALALGIPVISCESPAAAELLTDQQDVLLVPAGDAQALADKIRWAARHREEILRIAQNGQELFTRQVSPNAVTDLLEQTIQQTLSRWQDRDHQRALDLKTPSPTNTGA